MSSAPPNPSGLRASDADREAAAARLQQAATEGRIDPLELDERLGATYEARWLTELHTLVADVTPPPAPAPPPAAPAVPPTFVKKNATNGFAVAALVVAITWWFGVGSLLGIAFGHIALYQIKRSKPRQGGTGLAIGALAISYLTLGLMALGYFFGGG